MTNNVVWEAVIRNLFEDGVYTAAFNVGSTCQELKKLLQYVGLYRLKHDFGIMSADKPLLEWKRLASPKIVVWSMGTPESPLQCHFEASRRWRNGNLIKWNGVTIQDWCGSTIGWIVENNGVNEDFKRPEFEKDENFFSEQFASGEYVILGKKLKHFLSKLVPKSLYMLSRWRGTPVRMEGDCRYHWFDKQMKIFNSSIGDYGDECDHVDVHRGIVDGSYYVFEKLQIVGLPLHEPHDEERVEYYKDKFRKNKEYAPTVLLIDITNAQQYCSDKPFNNFSRGAIIIDGHHKLAAACDMSAECQIILVDARNEDNKDSKPLPWSESELTKETINQFKVYMPEHILL